MTLKMLFCGQRLSKLVVRVLFFATGSGRDRVAHHRRLRAMVLLSTVGIGLGCGGDIATGPALRSPAQGYYTLQVNQMALNLALTAPANTFHLTATPLNAEGVPLLGLGRVTYSAADSTVTVESTGLVTARFVTPGGIPTHVIVTLQSVVQNVTHADTVAIQVTTMPPPALTTFSMRPTTGDSAKRAAGNAFLWPVKATNTANATVCDSTQCSLLVHYTSSNPSAAKIDPLTGQVTPVDTGHTVLTAATWSYGTARRDSVVFTIGYQVKYLQILNMTDVGGIPTLAFGAPKTLILGVGAEAIFWNRSGQPVDVVFDHPDSVSAFLDVLGGFPTGMGNIPAFGGDTVNGPFALDNFEVRGFHTPGTYYYHSTVVPSDTFAFIIAKD